MEYLALFFWVKGCLPSSNNCNHDDFCRDLCIGCTCDFKQVIYFVQYFLFNNHLFI